MKNQYRKGVRTVAVHILSRSKHIYRLNLEMRLTEAIVKRIELDTPYKVVDQSRADTLLTGTIKTLSQRVMSFSGSARELEMVVAVEMNWQDLRTGKPIIARKVVRAAGLYIRQAPLSEDFFQGSEEALNRLAIQVVEQMEADW
ncbi:MAG: hypothetical protein J7M14_02760 [Planctomycetes bacterium]|nr:hypothetical protein [Planctomycetota bacterium]